MFINEFVWMYRTVFFYFLRFAVAPSTFCFDTNLQDCVRCLSIFSSTQLSIFQSVMLKTTLTGDREFVHSQLRPFSVSQVVSTYALLG